MIDLDLDFMQASTTPTPTTSTTTTTGTSEQTLEIDPPTNLLENVNLGMIAVYKQQANLKSNFQETHEGFLKVLKTHHEENELIYRRVLAGYMEQLSQDMKSFQEVLVQLIKANNALMNATAQFQKELYKQTMEFQLANKPTKVTIAPPKQWTSMSGTLYSSLPKEELDLGEHSTTWEEVSTDDEDVELKKKSV